MDYKLIIDDLIIHKQLTIDDIIYDLLRIPPDDTIINYIHIYDNKSYNISFMITIEEAEQVCLYSKINDSYWFLVGQGLIMDYQTN